MTDKKLDKLDKLDKLAIIVPYRNRKEHLCVFIPYMKNYFTTQNNKNNIDPSIYIIEQANNETFNRGKLLNVGFELAYKDGNEYVCFHDVDYLPVNADYSKPTKPTRLIWKGLTKREDPLLFFGAVVLFPCDQFIQVNGFSNEYCGWGFEDTDLHFRIAACGLSIDRRDQEFKSLQHAWSGVDEKGSWLPEVINNKNRFFSIKDNILNTMKTDGLSTVKYRAVLEPLPPWESKDIPLKIYSILG